MTIGDVFKTRYKYDLDLHCRRGVLLPKQEYIKAKLLYEWPFMKMGEFSCISSQTKRWRCIEPFISGSRQWGW